MSVSLKAVPKSYFCRLLSAVVGPEFSNTETFLMQTQSFIFNNKPKTSEDRDLYSYTFLMGWQKKKEHNKGIHPDQPTRIVRQGESRGIGGSA